MVDDFYDVTPYTGEGAVAAVPAVPMQRAQTPYITAVAVQQPRDLDKLYKAVMREAAFAGADWYYAFPMGGKRIEGPSIGLAMAVARLWGNCAMPVEYYETTTEWIFTAHFVDLETGFTVSRVYRKKKGVGQFKKFGDRDPERAEDMVFQAAQSKAIRNVVTNGVPRWLVNEALEAAKKAALAQIDKAGVRDSAEKAAAYLAGYGVTEEMLVKYVGAPKVEWTPDDILGLRGIASQLRDGVITPQEVFEGFEAKTPAPAPTEAGGDVTEPPIPLATLATVTEGTNDPEPELPPPHIMQGRAAPETSAKPKAEAKKGGGKKEPPKQPALKDEAEKAWEMAVDAAPAPAIKVERLTKLAASFGVGEAEICGRFDGKKTFAELSDKEADKAIEYLVAQTW